MNKNKVIVILIVLFLCLGGYLVYAKLIDNNQEEDNSLNNGEEVKQLYNYDVESIQNVIIEVPMVNSQDPEKKSTTILNKEEIKNILLNIDNVSEVGKIPNGIGFETNVVITINYDGEPSTQIIILDNGNVAINFSVGLGETGFAEYEIENKNLASELINKYQ